jgi:DNA-binding response OmpR family regulator
MKSILIIDDDEKMRDALKQYFDESGYRVIEASNGKNALALLKTIDPTWLLPTFSWQRWTV